MSYENQVGKFLNEEAVLPGFPSAFDDPAAPEGNDLIEDKADFRNEYYQEDVPFLTKVGVPKGQVGEADPDAQILKGTVVGDTFEGLHNAWAALQGQDSGRNLYGAALKAWGVAADAVEIADMAKNYLRGIPLAKFDPFNYLGGQLMGWMLEHVEPLRKSLDSLAGNPDMVKAYSSSWAKISQELAGVAADWQRDCATRTAGWVGATADAYRAKVDELTADLITQAGLADVLSTVNQKMADVVDGVRGIITEILNSLAGVLVEIAAILIASAGSASPGLIARAVFEISTATMSVSRMLTQLATVLFDIAALADDVTKMLVGVVEVQAAAAQA
ncbi:WXG100 family type VII secretion target [Nocardia farcinica]|uniref:WXG100 family type VII secretion target n=1 Tax=Nocardia farcinica TaxID=37329 RepID=UPI0024543DB6|nr:hypothetical protein [Nocardia farcinica]